MKAKAGVMSVILIWGLSFGMQANITLPKIFGSNMVLQQGIENKLWGYADVNETIKVLFANKEMRTIANASGKWEVHLPVLDYGGPYSLVIQGKNTVTLNNILIGEVWVCSGQSNMEFVMQTVDNAEEEIANATNNNIRVFTVPRAVSQFPQNDLERGNWQICSPTIIPRFSAVAYFFGRKLQQELNVPIGLIMSAYGGTVIETWTSGETIGKDNDFREKYNYLLSTTPEAERQKKIEAAEAVLGEKLQEKDPGLVDGNALFAAPDLDDSAWKTVKVPAMWENQGFPNIDGVGWYRKTFILNKEDLNKDGMISLAKMHDQDITWINGHYVGEANTVGQRTYDIPAVYLKEGKNLVTVRIFDGWGGGGLQSGEGGIFVQIADKKIPLEGDWKLKITEIAPNSLLIQPNDFPTLLYNGMINPLTSLNIGGVIWYQGESNVDRASQYKRLFPALIRDWRKQWDKGDFPFLFVSLASYLKEKDRPSESKWAELREAQTEGLKEPNTGMAVTIDIGMANNIHPTNKQDVGLRLALNALHITYKKDLIYSGPVFASSKIEKNKIILRFDHAGAGLETKDHAAEVHNFEIAGYDKIFYNAQAAITGTNEITVQCNEVSSPVYVRFAWADNPPSFNLYNKEGLPAVPFRTDNHPQEIANCGCPSTTGNTSQQK